MHNPDKKIIASLLLFSHMLTSCYNPNIGIGKQALPAPADPAYKQRQYEEPHDKYPQKPTNLIFTTADNHPVRFTYHNGQWQAAIKECASSGSWQRRQVPVVFELGLTLEDLVDSNPTEQKQMLHICPDYVYIGRTPIQAKLHQQLLSSLAAREIAPRSEVGLPQQQATIQQQPISSSAIPSKYQQAKQRKQVGTRAHQAQKQPGSQAVLALTSAGQQERGGVVDNSQLPRTPAHAGSKSLSMSSSELPSQQAAKNQATSAQQVPSRKTISLRNQNKLLHSQRAAQAKRQEITGIVKLGNERVQTTQRRQAIVPIASTPTQPPSLADKAPQDGITSQVFLSQGGQQVRFVHQDGQWWASVMERIGVFSRVMTLPVVCEGYGDIETALLALQEKPDRCTQRRIHVLPAAPPYLSMVYLGGQGLLGGMRNSTPEASGSGEPPTGEPSTQGSGQSQLLVAPQDREVSLVTLQERMVQGNITSTSSLVDSFNAAQTPEEQQALEQWIQKYIRWFNDQTQHVGNLALMREEVQEYTCLAHIKASTEKNRRLLRSYFDNLCNKIDREYQHGEVTLLEALEYTLQNMDSHVFEGNPAPLIHLGNTLLAKLDTDSNKFTKDTYPTYRSTLYALHQTLVLIQQISHSRLNPTQDELYSRFKTKIDDLKRNAAYYPIRYHVRLLKQSLQRLARYQARLQDRLRRVGQGLKGGACLYQGAHALSTLVFDIDAFLPGYASLQAASGHQYTWYDWHQAINYAGLLSLEDPDKYRNFEECLKTFKAKEATMRKEKDRKALRFGIVMQLRMLALHGPTGEVRKKSIKWLEDLANLEEWGGDGEVMEGLLDGLASIAVHSQREEGGLFSAINSLLRVETLVESQAPAAAQEARRALRVYYQQPLFAQVHSLFGGKEPKHVDSLQCQLMLIEQVKVKADREGQQDHLSTHHERLERIKTAIALEDLFKRRSTKPGEAEREIQKVLLVGEAGTGKTMLSRKLAYSWAQRTWGEVFEAVYVLPVRELQQSKYDNVSMRRDETLATAIANHCFHPKNKDEEYERLRRQISEELERPTTLVVLDELDERYGASEKLLGQALGGSHKLLLLSRPYGIDHERTLVDLEIEHMGLSDGQMEDYVRGDLSSDLAKELLAFIRAYPAIEAIAHVPVNLQILCALWQDDGAGVHEESKRGSLPGLYRKLTGYIWKRYTQHHRERGLQNKDREALFDTLGEIALRALEGGEVLLSPELVEEVLERVPIVQEMLQESGLLQKVGRQYQFPHLTLQEYFAGRWLARQLLSSSAEAQSRAEKFFSEKKYEHRYGVMVSFLAGEMSKLQGVAGTRKLLSLLEEDLQEVVGVQHLLLQLRCLNEWLCVAGEDLEAELVALEEKFQVMNSLQKWFLEGLERVRREDDRKLLELLTTALQGWRAIAAHAPALLELLEEAMRDDNWKVHRAAREALGDVVQATPEQAERVLSFLIEAMQDAASRVRIAASKILVDVAKAASGHVLEVLPLLLEAMRDAESWVRSAASEALRDVVQALPEHAPEVLPPLLEAMRDAESWVRSAASEVLGDVVKAAPEHAPEVLPSLLEAMRDAESWVRSATSEALGAVVQAAPQHAKQVLPLLIKAMSDTESWVCSAASKALGAVAKAAPQHAKQVLSLLIKVMRDNRWDVRSAARYALGEVVQAAPQHTRQVLPLLIEVMRGDYWDVHSAAREALRTVAKASPEHAEQVLQSLIEAMRDNRWDVRSAASEALGDVVQTAPQHALEVLPPLLEAMRDAESWVRFSASKALGDVVKATPEHAEQVLQSLIEAMRDHHWDVRSAASEALGNIVKVMPEHVLEVLRPLREARRDEDEDVRSAVIEALGDVVQAAPEHALKVLRPLREAMQDEYEDVRRAASKALGDVVKAAPEHALEVLSSLIEAKRDPHWDVRRAASEALEGISLQLLIGGYWATQDQTLIPVITTQLYHTPLLVQTSQEQNQQRLVLYPTTGQSVAWEKPHQEVKHFVQLIQSAAKKRKEVDHNVLLNRKAKKQKVAST